MPGLSHGQVYCNPGSAQSWCYCHCLVRFYVPRNKKRSGYVILVGLRSSIIEYSKETLSWQLVEQTHNTTATAED